MTLKAENVRKSYGPVQALDGVSLRMVPGEVRALLGGNGSGKSTLSKTLTGVVAADQATVSIDGAEVHLRGPADAARVGVGATYQEVALSDDLSVAENLCLAKLPRSWGLFAAPGRRRPEMAAALGRVGLDANILQRKVRDLPLADRALVELAKVLLSEPRYLVLDELTASLRREAVTRVGELLRELTTDGVSVLFVSHRLEEVEQFCDTATVLRGGRVVLEGSLTEHSVEALVAAMTGDEDAAGATRVRSSARTAAGTTVLEVRDLLVPGASAPVSLQARAGEIVGLAGLSGQGQGELLRALGGVVPATGRVSVREKEVRLGSARSFVDNGVGFVSGEREREMAFGARPVSENIRVVARSTGTRFDPAEVLDRLAVPATHRRAAMRGLSGGQQQKVILGRWLGLKPAVLLADDPTRGVDVTTRIEIHRLLRELADAGSTVLLTSSDDHELGELCDRVYLVYGRAIVGELSGDDVNERSLADAAVRSGINRTKEPA